MNVSDYRERFPDATDGISARELVGRIQSARRLFDRNPNEVPTLRRAIIRGRIDGSIEWDRKAKCGCLLGWLAIGAGAKGEVDVFEFATRTRERVGRSRSAGRTLLPAELLVLGIDPGDTPKNSADAALLLAVIDEWIADRAAKGATR